MEQLKSHTGMISQGKIYIYTGNGKGKTTAAFGQALCFVSKGGRACVIQFMKGREYGECLAAKRFLRGLLDVHLSGLDSFVMRDNPALIDIELAKAGINLASETLSKDYGMLILDEVSVALDFGLVSEEDVIGLIKDKPPAMELVITGRYASAALVALADVVTEIKDIRHHYQKGIKERAGMEF
ncbi:MAG: cob(I)yrinic acid a,c-diamide adenosyltransferase [Deltaproteobacteria bacterium]|nr:cob(I)yrinic acid a,c-diamide adenosyltransferase [Deltaproteobacteria bacterium]